MFCILHAVDRKHRRSWTTVRTGPVHPSSGYQASIAKLESSRGSIVAVNVLDWINGPSGIETFEPRYRVLLRRPGSQTSVGVAMARNMRCAVKQLEQVERILAASSHDQVKQELGLDF
jgi:hypothetical protein